MKNILKTGIRKKLPYFSYFYHHLKYRLFFVVAFSLVVGVFDGFGLAMFLPLLETVSNEEASAENLGNLGFLIDYLESSGIGVSVITILVVMLIFFILKGIARFFETLYRVTVQQYFMQHIRYMGIDGLTSYDYTTFVTSDAGRIQNTLTGETGRVNTAFYSFAATIQSGALILIYGFFAFNANPEFTLFVGIGGGLTNVIFKVIYNRTKKLSRSYTKEANAFEGIIIQMVLFFKYLKATGQSRLYGDKLKRSVDRIKKDLIKVGFYNAILKASREPLIVTVVVIIIIVQVEYFGQEMSGIILSLLFFYRALGSLVVLQTNWNHFLETSGSLENMSDFLKGLKKNKEADGEEIFAGLEEEIEMVNLSFGYGGDPVLRDINLKIGKNKTVAFVGESGSGKTTAANLIAGLFKPTEGDVLINGKSITDYNIETYRKRIGYITQDAAIFTDTVFNNVTLWAEPNEENIGRFERAIKSASLENFINSLELKEQTEIGNNGINLSGGQKQRISIARELFKEVDILILDEATSALDSATEIEIKESIESLKGNYTIIMVAHRLSTIRTSDIVVLLDNGQIVAKGTYDELLANNSGFSKMVSLQKL